MASPIRRSRSHIAPFAAAIAVLVSGCADAPTTPAAAPAEPTLHGAAVNEIAAGSGHFRQDGYKRTFTFNARNDVFGNAEGSYHVTYTTAEGMITVQGDVTCLRIIGNEAWVGGVNPNGTGIAFRVRDADGSGRDEISMNYYSPFYGPTFPEFTCLSALALPLRPVDAGNLRVEGERHEFATVYEQDFENPVGAEWSHAGRTTSPNGHTFLGEFSSIDPHGPTLTLDGLPPHRYVRVSLDLYAIRTLDGSDDMFGLDLFTFSESETGFTYRTTFSGTGAAQAFPGRYPESEYAGFFGASGIRTLGYVWTQGEEPIPMDAVYPVEFTLAHTSDRLLFKVIGEGLQDFTDELGNFTDESWGIDNVRVEVRR